MDYAVLLTSNGYTSVESILSEESIVLVTLMMDRMPWKNAYCEEDLSAETENEFTPCNSVMCVDTKSIVISWSKLESD